MSEYNNKQNCWDFFDCKRDPDSIDLQSRSKQRLDPCNVGLIISHNGKNSGKNGGRYCWNVQGSYCEISRLHKAQDPGRGSQLFKEDACDTCDFKKLVMKEEGALFTP